jgi:pilus assembly protein CpaD
MSSIYVPIAKRSRSAASIAAVLAIIAATSMLAGCNTTNEVTGAIPTDYRQRHPIVLKESPRTVELLIGTKRGALTGAQRADVLAFANEWNREATGGILIDLPAGTPNEYAAASAVQEVRSILSAAGVPAKGVEVRPYRPADPGKLATLKLSYPAVIGSAGPCGLWPYDLGPTFDREHNENVEFWNLGCAYQRNLAAMVDNPADLVQPRGTTPAYTPRRTTAIEKYRAGQDPSTVYSSSDKGKVSEVGK